MRILLLLIFLIPSLAFGQKFNLSGILTDTLNSPLPSATIMLLNVKDSSLVNFGVSDTKGAFSLKNIAHGKYIFKVSFVGYATHTQSIAPDAGVTDMDLGRVKLKPQSTQLDEVVVQGEKVPVTVKRDTIEFNAGSFKTKANASVEDLLKKLPGVDVENDGTVRAQGEQVQRVTVDGKEFFGRDPKLATRNLPADAVDKVQVFDRKSEQSQFTGIDDGQREKTINLELKAEKRNGAFGTMMAGGGTNDRYQARANVNRFTKGKQLSFLGMGNNVNEQGFSITDYMNFSGGSQALMGGGGAVQIQLDGNNSSGVPMNFGGRQNGILTNYAGGLNFNNTLSKKTEISGSYFYNHLDQNVDRTLERINYTPNGNYNYNSFSKQRNKNENHRLNFTIDHKIDSSNSIRFNTNASLSDTRLATLTESETMTTDNTLQNTSVTNNTTLGNGLNVNSSLLYRHRFNKLGRSISVNVNGIVSQSESNGELTAENSFYEGFGEKRNISQENDQVTDNQTLATTVSFIEPLGGRKYLEATYNFRTNRNQVERNVYDVNNGTRTANDQLSNVYNSNYLYNRPGLSLRINRSKYNLSLGASWQKTVIDGRLVLREVDIYKSFQNVLPVARLNYDFSAMKHLRLEYETSMQEPSIQQLQPVIDNTTNQINQSVGNPELQPGYNHRINANFNSFDPAKGMGFFAFVNGTYTSNAISYGQTINPNLSTLTMPVNVKNSSNINANVNFGFPLRQLFSRITLGPTASQRNSRVLLNEEEVSSKQETLGGTARYNFTFKDFFVLDLSMNLSNQLTRYESTAATKPQDQSYFNKTYTAETNLTVLKNYQLNAAFDYLVYDSKTTGFNQSIPLLNVSVSRFFFKAQSGELKLGVVNMLDQSLSVSQQASVNYLEQTTYNNLGRYYMVSFTYSLNKQLNPMGNGPRRGGMRMIMN
ncbi:MAG TPA: outer membrane beta-barrel protein [Cyclobacteriaceae bacterium]|nr:outer membrane beta-barrel protein [Cyclobacteriaceae bacterium]